MHVKYLLLASALLATSAQAESLSDAVRAAYESNPVIAGARAQLRQVDENVPIAQAGGRPTINLVGDFTQQLNNEFYDTGQIWRGGAQLVQPIYQGGRVSAGVSAAEAQVAAARARLRETEYQVIVDTITAYVDVLKSNAVVALNEGQVKLLSEQLRASQDRFEVGDLTRTDVAQSEARLAAATAGLQAVSGQRILAQQAYRRIVGHDPVDLEPLPPLPEPPPSDGQARDTAFSSNPALAAARFSERAAMENVRVAKGARGPNLNLNGGAQYVHGRGVSAGLTGFTPSLSVSAGMPLFSGGLIAARVRQSQAAQSQALENITLVERLVSESATGSYTLLRTAEAQIDSVKLQISANELAAEGVRQENEVGNRDVLDVLNAEQELLNSRVNLVQAERDRYVATYRLYQVMGTLESALPGSPIGRYDPEANAARVRGKWLNEFGYDPDPRTDLGRNYPAPVAGPTQ